MAQRRSARNRSALSHTSGKENLIQQHHNLPSLPSSIKPSRSHHSSPSRAPVPHSSKSKPNPSRPSSTNTTPSSTTRSAVADTLRTSLRLDGTPASKKPRPLAAARPPLRERNYVIEEDEITPAPPKKKTFTDPPYIPSQIPQTIVIHSNPPPPPIPDATIVPPSAPVDTTSDFLIASLLTEQQERPGRRTATNTPAPPVQNPDIAVENPPVPAAKSARPKRRTRRQLQIRPKTPSEFDTPPARNLSPTSYLPKEVPPDRPSSPRLPFREIHPLRPAMQTYGKRRRAPPPTLEMPSMRSLGVVKPRSPGDSSTRSGTDETANKENEEFEAGGEESAHSSPRASRGNPQLDRFMRQQRLFWADVDKVELEEDID